ncbi:MAG TPA: NnrU family protein [Stellaceae bacterium]|nr:NnrU family protein [Stellaceae bacterium]
MTILILGLVVFLGGHAFTMMRGSRAALVSRLGERAYKGLYSLIALLGLVLLVYGYGQYRSGGMIPVWSPPDWTKHITFVLMLFALVLLPAAYIPSHIKARVKHPMITAVKTWAFAHLLVRGDLGSMLLFGAFLIWGVTGRISMKQRGGPDPVVPVGWINDIIVVAIGLGLYAGVLLWFHPSVIGVPLVPR